MSTPLTVLLDETEPQVEAYRDLAAKYGFSILVKPGETIGAAGRINYAFDQFPRLDWYAFTTDDSLPSTKGWDVALSRACVPASMAVCDAGLRKQKYATFAVGGDLARALGFIVPPGLEHYGGDRFWKSLSAALACRVVLSDVSVRLPDHVKEHDAPATWDATKARQKARQSEDKAVWREMEEIGYVRNLAVEVKQRLMVAA